MAMARTPISGSSIDYGATCTSSKGSLCHIFRNLSHWNELFWYVQLELKELSPGELTLVDACRRSMKCHLNYAPEHVRDAVAVLGNLLTRHHCLVSVNLANHMFDGHRDIVCDALRKSANNLRKLELNVEIENGQPTPSFLETLPHLKQLQEVKLVGKPFEKTSIRGLPEFLVSTRSLTTLTMPRFCVEGEGLVTIIRALKGNATIKALSVNACLLFGCAVGFGDYLSENQTLRSLSLTSCHRFALWEIRRFIGALYRGHSISELSLIDFSLDNKNIKSITRLLCHNRSVRRFHLDRCSRYDNEEELDAGRYKDWPRNETGLISPWLTLLAKNKTLNELTLDLSSFSPEQCRSFFEAIARNQSLEKVNVQDFRHEDVAQICRALRDNDVQKRFFFGNHYVTQGTAQALEECEEITHISIDNTLRHCRCEGMFNTLHLLPTCTHVKSFCLMMGDALFDGMWSSLIANCITDTKSLKELKLEFDSGNWHDADRPERVLLEALSMNKNIQRLSVERLCFNESETQTLVDTLISSRTLWDLTYKPLYHQSTTWFIEKLAQDVSTNYTLLSVNVLKYDELCRELFAIADTVRRNNTLVMRAAHFVEGRRDRYCAAAAELVHFHPVLLTKVQQLASIDENEAASKIEGSVKSFTELDDFMSVAGVVKSTMTCHRRDDGRKQLADLNSYCWLHLRGYLKVADISGSL
ncbi:hypothetical protein HPB51_027465 [Rhipicephalus microplus]|uniref:Uncharacterized protein n=1 Tax=Rhipicephalus microplus TaxID=6941 RepID=A0A9J6D0A4_RHIMP|nr:hypothetical protein HPB51_027465 [Rhipicephalus microplus]